MDSQYPSQLDSDLTIPAVDDNITEIGGDAINGLRSAVFNIEETLGLNPQGTTTDVSARLDKSLNSDGSIKASALSAIGLVTLPIVNSEVATNAGIEESKLDLDYTTTQLKTWIDELWALVDSIASSLADLINKTNRHIAHPSTWGRHQTQDIDGYLAPYVGYNLQGIVNDLDTRIYNHIIDPIDAHEASAISADDTYFEFVADNVQTALEKLSNMGISTMIAHRDNQHGNGILSTQEVVLSGENHSTVVVSSAAALISVGGDNIRYVSLPTGFGQIKRGDRIDFTFDSKTYSFYVSRINSSIATVYFFGVSPVGGTGTAIVYRASEEVDAPSVLKAVIRQPGGTIGGSVIQIVHPDSPYIISSGFNPVTMTSSIKNISFRWSYGESGDVDAYSAMQTFNSAPSTWTADNFADVMNSIFRSESPMNHFPIVAFSYKGEIGFAFDEPDGYLEIIAPTGNSAWSALGFTAGDKAYSLGPRKFYIDGYEYSSIRILVDATGNTSNSTIVSNIPGNIIAGGVKTSGIVRISNHVDKGTYVFDGDGYSTTSSLTIGEHTSGFVTATGVGVKIYADSFYAAPSKRTLYELFLDGYYAPYAQLNGAPRVEYYNCSDISHSQNPEEWFDVISVSRDFINSEKRVYFDGAYNVSLGDRGSSGTILNPGNIIALPITNAEGYQFKLYDGDGVNYIEFEIVNTNYIGKGVDAIDVDIYDRISEERYTQIATVLHNRTIFKRLYDRRIFGTTNRQDIGDDFKRDYISYPTSLLRGNGTIYGLGASSLGSILSVEGGQALVNGSIYLFAKTQFNIPKDGEATTYNLFVDYDGSLKLLRDDFNAVGILTTPSLSEIVNSNDKLIIAQIDVNISNAIIAVRDYRRFVGNIDNKIELLVEENNIINGSFASLRAAINYLNAQYNDYSGSRTIKIRGTVYCDVSEGVLSLPNGVIIKGENYGKVVDDTVVSKIILYGSGTTFIIPGNNCVFENILIENEVGTSLTNLIGTTSSSFSGLKINGCEFKNILTTNIISGNTINDCVVENCNVVVDDGGKFIYFITQTNNLIVQNNNIISNNYMNEVITLTSAYKIWILNNYIYTANGASNDIIKITSANNLYIDKNMIISFGDISGVVFHFITSLNDTYITNNIVEAASNVISNVVYLSTTSGADSVIINSNNINISDSTSCIKIGGSGSSIQNISMVNNIIYGGVLTGNAIDINSSALVKNIIINGNYVRNYNSISRSGNMINIISPINSTRISISKNVLINNTALFGSVRAMEINRINDLSISENIIQKVQHGVYVEYPENCIIDNNILLNVAYGVDLTNDGEKIFITNNIIQSTEASISPIFIDSAYYEVYLSNNILENSASVTSLAHISPVVSGLYISNNYFTSSVPITNIINLYSSSGTNNYIIENNIFKMGSLFDYGIKLISEYDSLQVFVNGNTISGPSSGDYIYINCSEKLNGVNINNNYINNTSSLTAAGSMVNVELVSGKLSGGINIKDNLLQNVTSYKGSLFGVKINDATMLGITGNIIDKFNYTSGKSIYVSHPNGVMVSNNIIGHCYNGIILENSGGNIICNGNFVNSTIGNVVLGIYDSATNNINDILVSNNYLYSSATTVSDILFVFTCGSHGLITGNVFRDAHVGSSLYLLFGLTASSDYMVTNNRFIGGDYSDHPIYCNVADSNLVFAFNNLKDITVGGSSGQNLIELNSKGVDYHNWGQTYTVVLPLSNLIFEIEQFAIISSTPATAGISSWKLSVGTSPTYNFRYVINDTTFISSSSHMLASFGTNIVPVGSTINEIDIRYDVDDMTTLQVGLYKRASNWSFSQNTAMRDVTAGTGIQTEPLVPTTSIVMGYQNEYFVILNAVDSISTWSTSIYGININYTL